MWDTSRPNYYDALILPAATALGVAHGRFAYDPCNDQPLREARPVGPRSHAAFLCGGRGLDGFTGAGRLNQP